MRHALFLPIFEELAEPITVARLAAEAEAAGWDGVFVWDHIAYRDVSAVADPWVTLAAMACATQSIRIGPMVTPLPRRRPLKLAREVATLDRLSRGRVTIGVGIAGDTSRELSGTGEAVDAKVRAAMLDEGLDVLTAAWEGETLTHKGMHYVVDGLATGPAPIQQPRPPIWVGLRYGNQAPLRRAARYDGVFPVLVRTPEQLEEVVAGVQAHRDPDAGPFDVAIGAVPGTDPAPYEAAGATWFLTSFSPIGMTAAAARDALREGPPR
jgi:alkanesulfonate monooxygenase SsuD/methylene tetrahydromethanopterin reductase-like flavin-dependent oxidoreductase (luciferase family)